MGRIVLALIVAALAIIRSGSIRRDDVISSANMLVFYRESTYSEYARLEQDAIIAPVRISGILKVLPVGEYVGLVHTATRFNGWCSTAGPVYDIYDPDLKKDRALLGFPLSRQPESRYFSTESSEISLNRYHGNNVLTSLIIFYPVSFNDTDFVYEPKETRVLPPPVACGYVISPHSNKLMDFELYRPR